MKLKRILSILTAAVLVTAAGCGSKNDSNTGNAPTQAPAATNAPAPTDAPKTEATSAPAATDAPAAAETTEGQELNIAIFEGGFGRAYWDEIVRLFEEDNPGVKVNMKISPTIGETIRPQIVAGNVPDFMNLKDNDQTGIVLSLIKDKGLLELTNLFNGPQYDSSAPLKDKIIDGFLQSGKCAPYGDGKIFLAPSNASPMGLIYNKTLFAENGWKMPVTWDDFFALGDLAKEKGIALFTYQGIYPGYVESVLFPAIAANIGLDDFKKITSFEPGIWTDTRVVAVLEQLQKIFTGGYLMEGTVALNNTQAQTDQMNNKALFIPCGTWMEGEMAEVERADGYVFGLTPPPVLQASQTRYIMSDVEQYSIPAGAKNPELAKRFLLFQYTDKAVALNAELNGGVLATKNALELCKPYLTDGAYGMYGAYDEPNAASIIVGFDAIPEGSKIVYSDEIFQPLSDVMTGGMSAQDWADSVDQAYQDIKNGK